MILEKKNRKKKLIARSTLIQIILVFLNPIIRFIV